MTTENKIYTPEEVAAILSAKGIVRAAKTPKEAVWTLIRRGKLRATKMGRRNYRISQRQLDDFLKEFEI